MRDASEILRERIYGVWCGMHKRCYGANKPIAYSDVTVCETWHVFEPFRKWCAQNPNLFKKNYEIDKDLTIVGNRIYRPDACDFVPQAINALTQTGQRAPSSLPPGVSIQRDRYVARVFANNKSYFLGGFSTSEEAYAQYKKIKERHIRIVAEKYKNQLSETIYNNLMNWSL